MPCVSRSAGVSGHFCFGCLGRSGSWSHWWCDGSWRVGVRSVCDGVPLGGLGGEPLGFGTTLPGPGRRWLSLSVRRRCWGRRVASPGRRRLRLGRWLSAAVALVTWRLARSLHFVACRWHGRSTPEQQSSGAAGRRNGAATWAPGRWSVGALGCWSLGARSAGMLVRWGGRAVGRRSAGAAGGRSGWAFRQWGGGATGRRGATAAERQNAGAVERQSSAALECRSSRVPRQWGAGVSVRRGAGAVGRRGAGAAECRCGGVLGWWGAGVPGWRSAGIVKCRGSGVVGCASNGAPECASNGVLQCRSGVFAGEWFIKNKTHIVFLGLFAAECLPQIVFCGLLSVVHSFATGRLPRIGRPLPSAGSPQGPLLRSDPFLPI